jgi:hypothetical protein
MTASTTPTPPTPGDLTALLLHTAGQMQHLLGLLAAATGADHTQILRTAAASLRAAGTPLVADALTATSTPARPVLRRHNGGAR